MDLRDSAGEMYCPIIMAVVWLFQLSETGESKEEEAWGEVDQRVESHHQVGGIASGILLSNDLTTDDDDTHF